MGRGRGIRWMSISRPALRDDAARWWCSSTAAAGRTAIEGMYRFVGAALAARGVLTVIPDYRLYPEVRFPAFMEDAAAAVAWTRAIRGGVRRRSATAVPDGPFGRRTDRDVAGAGRAAICTRSACRHGGVVGVIGLAGPYDFLPLHSRDPEDDLRSGGGTAALAADQLRHAAGAADAAGWPAPRTTVAIPATRSGWRRGCARRGWRWRCELYPGIGHRR